MGRKRTPWLVGLLLVTGVASIVLAIAALSGFAVPAEGDTIAGGGDPANALAVLAGTLFLLGIELARSSSRRAKRLPGVGDFARS